MYIAQRSGMTLTFIDNCPDDVNSEKDVLILLRYWKNHGKTYPNNILKPMPPIMKNKINYNRFGTR